MITEDCQLAGDVPFEPFAAGVPWATLGRISEGERRLVEKSSQDYIIYRIYRIYNVLIHLIFNYMAWACPNLDT